MNDIRDIVALNLRRLRRERRMTQVDLAFRAEVGRGYISELESAKYSATVEMIGKLARALNVASGCFWSSRQSGPSRDAAGYSRSNGVELSRI